MSIKPNWTIIVIIIVVVGLSGLAFFTYLEKPSSQSQKSQNPQADSPTPQDQEAMMQQIFSSIAELKKTVEKDPNNLEALVTLGNLYYDASKFEEAVIYYQRALKLDPKNSDVWTDLGTMYRQVGNIDSSIICYQKAIQVNPQHKSGWFNLGIVYMFDKKDDKKAVWAWKKFVELSPDDPHVEAIKEEIKKIEGK